MRVHFWVIPALLCCHSLRSDGTVTVQGVVELGEWPTEPKVANRYLRGPGPAPVSAKRDRFALIWLESADGKPLVGPTPGTNEKYQILQENLEFKPYLLCVPVGAKVSFPNDDDVHHNVFSYSPTKKFDLGRYLKGDAAPTVTFDQPGEVKLFCEVHKHMRASIFVINSPYRSTSDKTGRFELKNVPPGSYLLNAVVDERVRHHVPLTVNPALPTADLILALPKAPAP